MRNLRPADVGDAPGALDGSEDRGKAIGPDQDSRNSTLLELYRVEQTARTTAPSIPVREDHHIAILDALPLLGPHDATCIVRPPHEALDPEA